MQYGGAGHRFMKVFHRIPVFFERWLPLPGETLWMEWGTAWVSFIPPTSVGIVTENPLTGRKAQKCPQALQEHQKQYQTLCRDGSTIIQPFAPHLGHFSSPRGPNCYFWLKLPLCRGEDYFAYFDLAKIASKSGKCLKPKAILSFLGMLELKSGLRNFVWAPKVPF